MPSLRETTWWKWNSKPKPGQPDYKPLAPLLPPMAKTTERKPEDLSPQNRKRIRHSGFP